MAPSTTAALSNPGNMRRLLCRFPVTSGFVAVVVGLGAYQLYVTDHAIMLICIVYTVVLYAYFVKDLWND